MSAWDAACAAFQEVANEYGVRVHRSQDAHGETWTICAELRNDAELLSWIHATNDAGHRCHVSISRSTMTGAWSAWASITRSSAHATRPEAAHAASEDA